MEYSVGIAMKLKNGNLERTIGDLEEKLFRADALDLIQRISPSLILGGLAKNLSAMSELHAG